jgi:hypothetical protein
MMAWDGAARKKVLAQLEDELASWLGVAITRSVHEFLRDGAGATRLVGAQSALPIGHLELDPDLGVYDAAVGAIGLVWLLPACVGSDSGSNASATIEHFVDRCVDDAVVLRHFCLERARSIPAPGRGVAHDDGSLRLLPLSVELVLVVPDDRLEPVGTALRRIVAESGYLFSIGINLLRVAASSVLGAPLANAERGLPGGEVRRAFRWLLRETRQHFSAGTHETQASARAASSQASVAKANGTPGSPSGWSQISRFELNNYRVSGKRVLCLQDFPATARAAPIHVVHGRNGTGKTSLVEAIELAMTGKLEFVESLVGGPSGYGRVVRNSLARTDDCRITLSTGNGTADAVPNPTRQSLEIHIGDGQTVFIGGPERPTDIDAAVCRLDQRLMDRLVKAERNEDRAAILLKTLFPRDRALLDDYEAAQKGESRAFQRESWPSEQDLTLAREELTKLSSWVPKGIGEVRRHDRAELANDWLRWGTLLEVATEDAQITGLLSSAKADVDAPESLSPWIAAARPSPPDMHALEALEKRVRQLRAQLRPSQTSSAGEHTSVDMTLSDGAVRALDGVGAWLAGTASDKLGTLLSLAVEHDRSEQFADISIGGTGWAGTLLARLDIATRGLHALRARNLSAFPSIDEAERHHFAQLTAEHDAVKKVLDLERVIDERLARRIGELAEPLNEVVSLLTPARWAYDDIVTKLENYKRDLSSPTSVGGRAGISFGIAEPAAASKTERGPLPEARLNTAELNLLALAIFMLYAPLAEKNCFRMFVLDDPLQNMDELTVSCVARGLSRLQRIFPPGWRLLITIHGEENFRCLEQELYGAAYTLPWLSPKDSPASAPEVILRPPVIARSAQPQTLESLCKA